MTSEHNEDASAALPFTGERVIPGKVSADLWNEHISRYYLARSLASTKTVLDVGCGVGYGTQLLATVADKCFGFDISIDAVKYAVRNYGPRASYLVGSADAFPFASGSIELITCFEVIEHLANPDAMLDECARVLSPNHGSLLISTPNKPHYAKTRRDAGPNPFHIHEFDLSEFHDTLRRHFSFVEMFAQNQQEAVIFVREQCEQSSALAVIEGSPELSEAPFFLAMCGHTEVDRTCFAYLAEAGDRLTARERHIEILQAEQADMQAQLAAARAKLDDLHLELGSRTEWAKSPNDRTRTLERLNTLLEKELTEERLRIQQIQNSVWFRIACKWQRIRGRSEF